MIKYLKIFSQLLKTDFLIFKTDYLDRVISAIIWVVCVLLVTTYVLPQLGITTDYGSFYAIGTIVSCSFWEIWSTNASFVADLDGNKTILYYLTLPVPSWFIFIKQAISFAIQNILVSIIILPLSKLILQNRLQLFNFSLIKFLIMMTAINLFFGFASILTSGYAKNITNINRIWTRILFPLWFFGGAQYSWATMYKLSPKFAYFTLLNPLIYANEGLRVATLGQEGFLQFKTCLLMLVVFSIICGYAGIAKTKKRLDYV